MKKSIVFSALLLTASLVNAQELKTYMDSVSYAVGILWGNNIKAQGLTEINSEVMGQAIGAVLKEEDVVFDLKTASQMMKEHVDKQRTAQMSQNLEEGRAFLAKNAEREGVITLPSGLQYEVLQEGEGSVPTDQDKVTVHYEGTLINGDVFDSSIQRGSPATFPVTGVIKGWVEALQLMPVGSKWKLYIPPSLAYGERGAGGQIGPNATLIFEVELLEIEE